MTTDGSLYAAIMLPAEDMIRFIHLLAIAIGLGTVVSTDIVSFRRVDRPVTEEYIRSIETAHRIIVVAFAAAWFSGVALIGITTGFDVTSFTTKLWCKLGVVTALAATAYGVKRLVMPILHFAEGRTLMEAPLGDKLIMAFCAGMSMSGWGSALLLGGLGMAKAVPGWLLVMMIVGLHVVVVTVALRMALLLHRHVSAFEDRIRIVAAE
ncbi:hypothetical protein KHP62_01965 [Rhodobacteraceae bacterium NNCM2]|nr:hypothetical protein [Coraliihabitans acroporae]